MPNIFLSIFTSLHCYQQCIRVTIFLDLCQYLRFSDFLKKFSNLVDINYLSMALIWISLVVNEAEHLRMGCLLAIYTSLQHEAGDMQWGVELALLNKKRKAVEE